MAALSWLISSLPAASELPYARAGLSEREAAVHLLNRLGYGPRLEGETPEWLVSYGLERWVQEQLRGDLPDPALEERLADFPSLACEEPREVRQSYMPYGKMVEMAGKDGIQKPSVEDEKARKLYDQKLREFKQAKGISTLEDLFDETRGQKLVRAVYARNQLREVLTDFWFNHFNVMAANENIRFNVLDYENRGMRANALGRFGDLLAFTSTHPCMLYYLNNAQSFSGPEAPTTLQATLAGMEPEEARQMRVGQPGKRKNGGLNENYARELMELHTLGVDGGYTQSDVTEVARAFTGWTVFYPETENPNLRRMVENKGRLGYLRRGDFLFRADWHDAGEKSILGVRFPAGGGREEGERVLKMLLEHPSTARFVCTKLARRFVADEPPAALVDRLVVTFRGTHGNIREVMRTLVYSPEFYSPQAVGAKVKAPLELVATSLRATGAEVRNSRPLYDWLNRLGENLYMCAPPTGYSEDSKSWLSPGMLVNRMNYAVNLVNNRIGGVKVDAARYAAKDRTSTVQKLQESWIPGRTLPAEKLAEALQEPSDGYLPARNQWFQRSKPKDFEGRKNYAWRMRLAAVILGSPEFQRR